MLIPNLVGIKCTASGNGFMLKSGDSNNLIGTEGVNFVLSNIPANQGISLKEYSPGFEIHFEEMGPF